MFCYFTDLILETNPKIVELKDAQSTSGRVRILSRDDLIASKRAAGRSVDLEDIRMLELSNGKEKT